MYTDHVKDVDASERYTVPEGYDYIKREDWVKFVDHTLSAKY